MNRAVRRRILARQRRERRERQFNAKIKSFHGVLDFVFEILWCTTCLVVPYVTVYSTMPYVSVEWLHHYVSISITATCYMANVLKDAFPTVIMVFFGAGVFGIVLFFLAIFGSVVYLYIQNRYMFNRVQPDFQLPRWDVWNQRERHYYGGGRICNICDTNIGHMHIRCHTAVCEACCERWTLERPGAQTWPCCSAHRPIVVMTPREKDAVTKLLKKKQPEFNLRYDERQCPTCGVGITKFEGCNQMTCTECGTGFCWACGSKSRYNCMCLGAARF